MHTGSPVVRVCFDVASHLPTSLTISAAIMDFFGLGYPSVLEYLVGRAEFRCVDVCRCVWPCCVRPHPPLCSACVQFTWPPRMPTSPRSVVHPECVVPRAELLAATIAARKPNACARATFLRHSGGGAAVAFQCTEIVRVSV